MLLFRGHRIKALSLSLMICLLLSTTSYGEEIVNKIPVGHGFWGPQGGGQHVSGEVIGLIPEKTKNSKTLNIKEKKKTNAQ